ncbi:Cupin domain containing protein [Methylacidiphilum infernorum V4]|uniref:Cupin domain containing protein n=1 Tax=Methylacidiphilum infernorum (isolate V4) TaxID=481448 RepID=B3E055_METI4|nr:Cupin domain containing protein [Methylacidiphilum infernorum V4]
MKNNKTTNRQQSHSLFLLLFQVKKSLQMLFLFPLRFPRWTHYTDKSQGFCCSIFHPLDTSWRNVDQAVSLNGITAPRSRFKGTFPAKKKVYFGLAQSMRLGCFFRFNRPISDGKRKGKVVFFRMKKLVQKRSIPGDKKALLIEILNQQAVFHRLD